MKNSFTILLLTLFYSIFAQTPDFEVFGYASLNGGTTGGEGGQIVTPTNFTELAAYASGNEPKVILIDREFKGPNVLRLGSNKSLIGVGTAGFINQIGVSIQSQSNIIIRNIKFTMSGVPISNDGENKIAGFNFDPDCIAIQADDENLPVAERVCRNIWIDHCEFYNEDPTVMTDYDRYDGLVDVKNDCQYITISWNYFHDHHKACLSGKGNSDDYDRKTTMSHNKFENIGSRMPLFRFGKLHMLNNYMTNCPDGNGINVRINSEVLLEKNYFDNVKKPIFGKISENGTATMIDNIFKDCSRLPLAVMNNNQSPDASPLSDNEEFTTSSYLPNYSYSSRCVPTNEVPTFVNQYVGIGKISVDINEPANLSPSISIIEPLNDITVEVGQEVSFNVDANDSDGTIVSVEYYNETTLISAISSSPYTYTFSDLTIGNYVISAKAIDDLGATTTSRVINITVVQPTNKDCNDVEDGEAYLDDCGVCVAGTTNNTPCLGILEAETVCHIDGIKNESDNTGFSGFGYANTDNVLGATASWTFNSDIEQMTELKIRYANGGSNSRNGDLYISENYVTNVQFVPTGSWDNWQIVSVFVPMGIGSNTISLSATGEEGLANIDAFHIYTGGVESSNCTITGVNNNEKLSITVFPNPTKDKVFVSESRMWMLLNELGYTLIKGEGKEIDLSNYPKGIYILSIDDEVIKIIKE